MKYTKNQAVDVLVWDTQKKASQWLPGRFIGQVNATDREYRYHVVLDDGWRFPEAAPECVKPLGSLIPVRVKFADPKYNYETSVAKHITDVEAQAYFKGKEFNLGTVSEDDMQTCTGIDFNFDN
jgi:hypothetical protein